MMKAVFEVRCWCSGSETMSLRPKSVRGGIPG